MHYSFPIVGASTIALLALGGYVLMQPAPTVVAPITYVPTTTPVVQIPEDTQEEPTPAPDPVPVPANWTEIVWADRSKQQVVFTFDGGAGNHSIDEILAALEKHDVTATFFVTGKWAEQNTPAMQRINTAGHEIFNHTYSHPDLTLITASEIAKEFAQTERIIKDITGKTTKPYFRPPYGARNRVVWDAAQAAGYRSVYWTVDALDWKPGISEAEVRDRVLSNLKPGTIYMMHIGDDITGRLLDELLTEIKSRGYSIKPLTEAL